MACVAGVKAEGGGGRGEGDSKNEKKEVGKKREWINAG